MTRSELDRLNDHDLLLLLHERMQVHMEEHRRATITFRWTVGITLSVLLVMASGAAVIGSLGNP